MAPQHIPSSQHGDSPVRWQARELVISDDQDKESASVSRATDVWSFGMLCLEIMTGLRPYSHLRRDGEVIRDLIAKRLPLRPVDDAVTGRGLTDGLWSLMLSCWSWDASRRPSMTMIRQAMQSMNPTGFTGVYCRHCVIH